MARGKRNAQHEGYENRAERSLAGQIGDGCKRLAGFVGAFECRPDRIINARYRIPYPAEFARGRIQAFKNIDGFLFFLSHCESLSVRWRSRQ